MKQLVVAVLGGRGTLARNLLEGTAGTAFLHLATTFLALAISVVLARMLGAEGYGAFAFATALMHLLGVPATLGFSQLVVRKIAAYQAGSEASLTAGLLRRSNQLALAASFFACGLASLAIWTLPTATHDSLLLRAVWISLPAVPLLSLTRIRQSALQGLHRIIRGQVGETVAWPLIFLLLLGAYLSLTEGTLSAQVAVAINVVALAGTLVFVTLLLRRELPAEVKQAAREYRTREWLESAFPLVFVGALHIVNSRADTMMLAALEGAEAVGIYNVASRGAGFVGFFLMAGQRALAPTIATLYESGDRHRLQEVVTTAARLMLVASVPVALAFVLGGEWVLSVVYGVEFARGSTALAILSVGYLVGVAMGPTSYLLVMTGQERAAAWGVGVSGVLNVILNAILIPPFGLEGAAVATGLSLIAWNSLYVLVSRRQLGIRPTAFS